MLDWLANSDYAVWVNTSWGWPLALTLHAFGTATIVGFIFIMALRLLGVFRTIPYTALSKLIPYMWFAFVVQVFSGFTLWMTKPAQYLADGMFEVKFTLVVIAAIVMGFFQGTLGREASEWDATGKVSPRGLRIGAAACVLWSAVTIGGRLTAYLGSLYPV